MKIQKAFLALIAFAIAALFSSCNTSRGFGQDLQKVGEKIENKSNEVY